MIIKAIRLIAQTAIKSVSWISLLGRLMEDGTPRLMEDGSYRELE